ncbi:hypothetical protein Mal4_04390 [Maioricimonas rarisocia]|uniref:DUF4878 domain-containing protein n=1 Tax=Maioricimonas rarisocia TaxID=2528026 RepID=A0A517Z0Z8_9PLAN|nr:hypothetical protein [Maioricimonas rarisocia]QDU36156.1 hypothetical protein Mal4_04390 [Maioricimonas rarisocia]
METTDPPTEPSLPRPNARIGRYVVIGALVTVPIAWGVLAMTADARHAGREFVNALRDEKYERAFDLCSSILQAELGDAEELARRTNTAALPGWWLWTQSSVRGNEARLTSRVRTWWSRHGLSVQLTYEEDAWRVTRLSAGRGEERMTLEVK